MNHAPRGYLLKSIVGLLFASTCYAGVDSPSVSDKQTRDITFASSVRAVEIFSRPAGAKILINGAYVGRAPILVDFAVDRFGRAVRNIELRAVAPFPMVAANVRYFPAAGTDGDSSRIPRLVDFDLNIHPVKVIR
jgi:PEGA domain-containing protein